MLDSVVLSWNDGDMRYLGDYLAHLRLSGRPCTVATNRIVCASRHRLCHQRFDADGQGCVLGVSHDPWGTAVSYSGYAILALCMMG